MNNIALPDFNERLAAKYTLGRNIIVEAGAGTGKTRLLVERLAFWILGVKHPGLDPQKDSAVENLVALTFTEKAAAEMKVRLAGRLQSAAARFADGSWSSDEFFEELVEKSENSVEGMARAARLAVQRLDRAQIGTIHSFASHILRLYPIEAGIDPVSEVDTGAAFDLLFSRRWSAWLERELSGLGGREELWKSVLGDIDISALEPLAKELCQSRMENFTPLAVSPELANVCAKKAARAAELSTAYLGGKAPRTPEKALSSAAASLLALSAALENGEYSKAGPDAPSKISGKMPVGWNQRDFDEACALTAFARTATVAGQKMLLSCAELLLPFAREMRAVYEKDAQLSFDDLLVKSRNLLRTNHAARQSLKTRYRTLLIDEFQDTDPLQGELLLYLAEDRFSCADDWRKVRLEPGKLFIVGDRKQSIYRFRGADISAYSQFEELMETQGATRCVLSVNFRSGRELISAVNGLMPKVMRGEPGLQPNYTSICPSPSAEAAVAAKRVSLHLVMPPENGAATADAWRENQAEFISGWIENNVGKLEIEPGRKLALKDIALLFRATTALEIYLNSFKRRGISYAVEEDRFFYSTQETGDLLNLLRVLHDPADKTALCGVLRSPLGGVTDRELYDLSRAGGLDYLLAAPAGFETVEELYAVLRELNSLAERVPLDALMQRILTDTFVPELLGRGYHGEQTVSNIRKFARIAAQHSLDEGLGLPGFIKRAGDFMDNRAREGESPLADEFVDAVRIMTVHKAKGLEFPVVLLPDITARRGQGTPPGSLYDWSDSLTGLRAGKFADCAMAFLQEKEERHGEFEEVRNFYVALTRARSMLLFVGNCQKPPEGSFGSYLAQAGALPQDEKDWGSFIPSPLVSVEKLAWREPGSAKLATQKAAAKPAVENTQEWLVRWKTRLAAHDESVNHKRFTSPTAIEREEEAGHVSERVEDFGAVADRLLLGKLCHRALELHDFAKPFTESEVKAALNYFAFQHHVPDYDTAAREALALLSAFGESAAYRDLAASEIIGRELPFSYAMPNGTIMRGLIDLVARRDGKLFVLDYKTDHVPDGGEAELAEKYRPQADAYRHAAALFSGGEIAVFKIIFLRALRCVEI